MDLELDGSQPTRGITINRIVGGLDRSEGEHAVVRFAENGSACPEQPRKDRLYARLKHEDDACEERARGWVVYLLAEKTSRTNASVMSSHEAPGGKN